MTSAESIVVARCLAQYGALPDKRLWRNETAGCWVGKMIGRPRAGTVIHMQAGVIRTQAGDVILRGARQIQAGLCVGSSDLIGVAPGGLFLACEVKIYLLM